MRRKIDTALASETTPASETEPRGTDAANTSPDRARPICDDSPGRPEQPSRPMDWSVRPGHDHRPQPPRPDQSRSPSSHPSDLNARLDALPDGHPSSPRDATGKPRPPAENLSDRELPYAPWTDTDWSDHVDMIGDRLAESGAAGLDSKTQFGVRGQHDVWTLDRADLHVEILSAIYELAVNVPNERKAIIAGGLPGSGKTTVLRDQVEIDMSQYLMINPDIFKEILAERGMIPKVDGLSPMEASPLVHEESSYLAWKLANRAVADGKNIIWDITMSTPESVSQRTQPLREHGYQSIEAIFVDIPVEISVARADQRHRDGEDRYIAGTGYGGRYVSADLILAKANADFGSDNRAAFEIAKDAVDRWTIFDNSVNGRSAVIVACDGRDVNGRITND